MSTHNICFHGTKERFGKKKVMNLRHFFEKIRCVRGFMSLVVKRGHIVFALSVCCWLDN